MANWLCMPDRKQGMRSANYKKAWMCIWVLAFRSCWRQSMRQVKKTDEKNSLTN